MLKQEKSIITKEVAEYIRGKGLVIREYQSKARMHNNTVLVLREGTEKENYEDELKVLVPNS